MAVWRRRARELFPELSRELAVDAYSVHQLFFDLVPRVEQAHADGNEEFLKRAYGFAGWCGSQNGKDLWNAAGVAFFEHAFDRWNQRHLVVPWLSPQVIADSWPLWESRLNRVQLSELRELFEKRRERKYAQCV
ncbi:MAG: hypothetical protein WAU32_04220 [Thermoanaerobaculia bacterium]